MVNGKWLLALMMLGGLRSAYAGKAAFVEAADTAEPIQCPMMKMDVVRLPDLNIPRAGHTVVSAGGETVAFGGHTTGFVPTPTAEYLKDGKWHLMDMTYTHDHAMYVPLRSHQVMLAGGSEKPLGIGQTFSVEMYDPQTHSFRGFGCLDQKRTLATGLELDSGRVLVTGNWYEKDGIELFDGEKLFASMGSPTSQRSLPYIFRTSRDNAVMFSRTDTCGHPLDTIWVDRLHGSAFRPALFDEWRPSLFLFNASPEVSFVGDESRGDYAYLFPVQHYKPGASEQEQQEAQVAISVVRDTVFSLLPTSCPVPMETPFGRILYYGNVLADRRLRRAYIVGCELNRKRGEPHRLYVLRIDYGQIEEAGSAPLTLYYTDPLPELGGVQPVLTSDGNLMMVGGGAHEDNFAPYQRVYLLPLGESGQEAKTLCRIWIMGAPGLVFTVVAGLVILHRRRKKQATTGNPEAAESPKTKEGFDSSEHLMQRIAGLMETKRLYLRPDLKLSDLSALLGVNSRYISDCINSTCGSSFSQFVNLYRVAHAKQLLSQQPETKASTIYMEAGFANETSFFRTFKSLTGMTPSEWRQRNGVR